MKRYYTLIFLIITYFIVVSSLFAQGTMCVNAEPFCTDSGVTYPAGTNNGNAPIGPNYDCLNTTPNPAWFYMRLDDPGTIDLAINMTTARDIDFAVWGPFDACTTPAQACATIFAGGLAPSDCSYEGGTDVETPTLVGTETGQLFIMLITNYSNQPTTLSITKTSGDATTDCAIVCLLDLGDDITICENDTRPLLEATCPNPSPNYRFEWFVNDVSQGAPSTTNTFTPNHTAQLTPVEYKVIVTEVDPVCAISTEVGVDSVNVTIRPDLLTNLTVFPNDTTLCSAGNAFVRVVDSEVDVSYQILQDGVLFGTSVVGDGGVIQLPLTGLTAGTSTIQVQAQYNPEPNCTVTLTEEAEITVLGDVIVDLGADSVICENRTLEMDALDASHPVGSTYQWFRSVDNGTTFNPIVSAVNPTYTASEVLPIPNTAFEVIYKVEVRIPASSCVFEDEKKIIFEPLPLVDRMVEVDSVCASGEGTIRVMNPQAGNYAYQLRENNAGIVGAAVGTPQTSPLGDPIVFVTPTVTTTTSYFIEVVNTNANTPCQELLTAIPEILVYPLPTAEFGGGADLCVGETTDLTITLTGTPPFIIEYRHDTEPIIQLTSFNAFTYTFTTDTAGVYEVVRIQDAFCENISNPITTTINVNPNPEFTLGNDTTICDSSTPLVLRPVNPVNFDNASYQWFLDGNPIIGAITDELTTTELSDGQTPVTHTYSLEVTNNETILTNCATTVDIDVTFNPNPVAEIQLGGNVASTELLFCDSDGTQTLEAALPSHTAFPNITYTWTDVATNTVVSTNSTLDVANFGTSTDYQLTITDGLTNPTCESTDLVRVTFIENPVAEISHNGNVIADGTAIDFCVDAGTQTLNGVHTSHAEMTVEYEWIDVTNGIPLGNASSIDIANPTNTFASIDYQLVVRNIGSSTVCENTTTITVNFFPNPEAEIQFEGATAPDLIQLCNADGVRQLDAALASHAAFPTITYQWKDLATNTIVSTNSTLDLSNFGASVTYELTVTDGNSPLSCERTDVITVEFLDSPPTGIAFGGIEQTELVFCTSDGAQLINAVAASPFYTYQWYRNDGSTTTTLGTNRTQTVDNFATAGGDTNEATYTVEITDTRANCTTPTSIIVKFLAEPETDATIMEVSALNTICKSGDATISVSNAEQGVEYQLVRNGVLVTGTQQIPTTDLATITFTVSESTTLVTGQDQFIYGIRATRIGDNGLRCTQVLEDTATVIVYPEPTATVTGTARVCADAPTAVTFTITGNFPAELTYQVVDTFGVARLETEIVGTVGSPSPQTFVITTNTNTYRPLAISDRYCTGTVDASEAVVTTVHPPQVTWIEYDTAFCTTQAATFEIEGGTNHQFYINGLPVSASNPYIIQPNTLEPGTYEIYGKGFATAGGCDANSDTITFRVHPLPVVDLGVDRFKCVEDTTYLVATQTGSFIYDWKSFNTQGDVISVGNGNDSLGVSRQGRYFVIVTNLATGCSDSSNIVEIVNYDTLDVDLGQDIVTCQPSGVPHRLIASDIAHPNGTTYKWFKDNSSVVIATDSVFDVTEEGIYRVTATDPRGCEARDTIRVNFTADPDFQIKGYDDFACGARDTLWIEATNLRNMLIDWQGGNIISTTDSNRRVVVDRSGVYTVTVTDTSTVANCSVTKSVEVFVRPAISIILPNTNTSDTTTLCQGDSLVLDALDPIHDEDYQYRWRWLEGNQVISSTSKVVLTYTTTNSFTSQRFEVKVTDPQGDCSVTDTVNVRFRRVSTAQILASDSVICVGESVTLQGSGGDQYEWFALPQTTSFASSQNVIITPDSAGIYTYVLRTRYNSSTVCEGVSDTITIKVHRVPVADLVITDTVLCENEVLLLDGFLPENPASTAYTWLHEENNVVLSTESFVQVRFDSLKPISYEPFHILLTVYDSLSGCASTDRVRVKFNRSSEVKIDSSYAQQVCIGESVTLTARGGTSYLWSTGETTQSITVQLDTIGFHLFTVTGDYQNGCQPTGDTAYIFVNPLPTIKAHLVDTVNICADDTITLFPSGGVSYTWFHDPTAFDTIRVAPKVPTDYIVMGTDSNGCQNTDTVHVYVTPTFELAPLQQLCEKESIILGDTLDSVYQATYRWLPTNEFTPFIEVKTAGVYTVEVTVDSCVFYRSVEVQFKEKPKFELIADTTLCFELGEEDRFDRGATHILHSNLLNRDSTTTYLYIWTDSLGAFVGNQESLEIDRGGNYRLQVVARYGNECSNEDSVLVTELCQPRIFIPEAFTPNGDNLNDYFEIFGKHVKDFEMQIFNRWGEVIYEVRAADIGELEQSDFWDGTHKGKNVPTGAYAWIVRYTDPFSGSQKQVQKSGSLVIVR